MTVPHRSTNFGDLLDPRFQRIFHEQYNELSDMVGDVFTMVPHNGRADMRFSQVGAFGDPTEFTGTVTYDSVSQGYDTTLTHIEFTSGTQVERKLFDDDQYGIMDQRPAGLAMAAQRKRQKDAARIYNNAFAVDSYFYSNSEGVALCSNSHTTTSSASTATGFDNLATSALTATALAAARIAHVDLRDDRANKISIRPDRLVIPINLYEQAYEIVASMGKVDTANNNRNVHESAYQIFEWIYLNDTNNWFLEDSSMRKMSLHWVDAVGPEPEFAFAEDLDTLVAKWRLYMRYSNGHSDWRFIYGSQVS